MEITFFDEQTVKPLSEELEQTITKALLQVEKMAGFSFALNILLADDNEIARLNSEFRGMDSTTDVLSFPEYELGGALLQTVLQEQELERSGENIVVGDIAISMPRALEQAEEYGHSLSRELSFLAVHGTLHLLGYDHMTPEDETLMRQKQKEVLDAAGLGV